MLIIKQELDLLKIKGSRGRVASQAVVPSVSVRSTRSRVFRVSVCTTRVGAVTCCVAVGSSVCLVLPLLVTLLAARFTFPFETQRFLAEQNRVVLKINVSTVCCWCDQCDQSERRSEVSCPFISSTCGCRIYPVQRYPSLLADADLSEKLW